MKAAVLHTLGNPPRYEDFPDPQPGPEEVIVHVKAASLKNSDKAMASGLPIYATSVNEMRRIRA